MAEEILIFEGANPRRKRCIRKKRVYSEKLGKHVLRCAEFVEGDSKMDRLGDFGQFTDEVKDTLITGRGRGRRCSRGRRTRKQSCRQTDRPLSDVANCRISSDGIRYWMGCYEGRVG